MLATVLRRFAPVHLIDHRQFRWILNRRVKVGPTKLGK
jgi:hypothetical protein